MTRYFLLILFLMASCSHSELLDEYVRDETEPNSATYEANEIEEGFVYRGKIEKLEEVADSDLFKIWKPAGTLVTLVFESDSEDFQFYVGHSDAAGHGEFVISDAPGRFVAKFVTSVNGWQYFEVGDRRNTSSENEFYSGFTYYFKASSSPICNFEADTLEFDESLTLNFHNDSSESYFFRPIFNTDGSFQLDVDSVEFLTDKAMFVIDCNSGELAAGNDDESFYDNLLDPLIYKRFAKEGNYIGVVTRLLADLRSSGEEEFRLSLKKQKDSEELEANNFYNYANVPSWENVKGKLVKNGEYPDEDWFKFDFFKGQIINVDTFAGDGVSFDAQIWVGTYPVTGSTIIPLRFSNLSANEDHHLNMLMPFTGSAYILLEGESLEYEFSVSEGEEIETLMNVDGQVVETIESQDCSWSFFKWNMPEDGAVFEIKAFGKTSPVGFHVFNSDLLPYAFIEPDDYPHFFMRRSDKTEFLTLGLYYKNCDQNSENSMALRITPVDENFHEWENGFSDEPVVYDGDGSYQGFIDTDNYFIENSFDIVAPKDGTLYLTTSSDGTLMEYNIDTVIYLYKGSYLIDENDEMIDFMKFNRYSRLTWDVKKGEKYTVKVRPYMTESSNVQAMNVTGNYILDIRIK